MATTMMKGAYKLVHVSANDNTIGELMEIHSGAMGDGSTTAPTDPQVMPKIRPINRSLEKDDKLQIWVKPDTTLTEAGTPAHTKVFRIPVRVRDTRSGVVYETIFSNAKFTSDRAAAAGAWTAGVWYLMDHYTVPAQTEIKLGWARNQDPGSDNAFLIHFQAVTS